MHQTIHASLGDLFYQNEEIIALVKQMEELIEADKISSYNAAGKLIDDFINQLKN
jgi:hypothetical protein